jgi:hypothetical protein
MPNGTMTSKRYRSLAAMLNAWYRESRKKLTYLK